MPVAEQIANAAASFHQNLRLFEKSVEGIPPEEWLKRPGETSNNLLWVTGHITWARSMALKFLGTPPWSRPWLGHFARGAKLQSGVQYPLPAEVLSAFAEVTELLNKGLDSAPAAVFESPAPPNSPSGNGKISGVINFLAYHETYHVGQIAYLCCWLGHQGPQG